MRNLICLKDVFTLFFLLFFYPLSVHSYPLTELGENPSPLIIPYEKCEEEAKERTNQVIASVEGMEAEFCPQCEIASSPSSATINLAQTIEDLSSLLIPKACFAAMAINGNRMFEDKKYAFCGEEGHGSHKGKKLCVDEDYTEMFQKAFFRMARCFNTSPELQKRIFLLMNHESGGVLNILSPSTAKCWGQVTGIYVEDLNKSIKSTEGKYPKKNAEIYTEAIERCPWIKNTISDMKDLKFVIKKDPPDSDEVKRRKRRNQKHLTCRSTSDPDLCLFYTFFGLNRDSLFIKQSLDSPSPYMGDREFSPEDSEKLKGFPIKRTEMARVKVMRNGEEKNWLIWDDKELYDIIQRARGSGQEIKIISAEKVPVFKDREGLETIFNWWAHNGGGIYTRSTMTNMIDRLRQEVSRSCGASSSQQERCQLRRIVTEGKGLSIKDVLPFFERDILRNHHEGDSSRKQQVSEYVRKTIQDGQNVFSYNGKDNGDFNTIRGRYENAGGYSPENAKNFQTHISNICPKIDSSLSLTD